MATPANITVNDREATPVAHVFVPQGGGPGFYSFYETASVPVGRNKLTYTWQERNGKFKIRQLVAMPVVSTEVVNGISRPKIERFSYAETIFTFDQFSTLQERKNLVGINANLQAASQTLVDSVLTGLQWL